MDDALLRYWKRMQPLLDLPYEVAGRARWTRRGDIVADHIRGGDTAHVAPDVVEAVRAEPAPFFFHTHPAAAGETALWPSPEDLVSSMELLSAYPDAADLVLTARGVIAIAPVDGARPVRTDARSQMRLYNDVCGVRRDANGYFEFPGRTWTWTALTDHVRTKYGWDMRYVTRNGETGPSEPLHMQARDHFWEGLHAFVNARAHESERS
jgi:hypothetical protein